MGALDRESESPPDAVSGRPETEQRLPSSLQGIKWGVRIRFAHGQGWKQTVAGTLLIVPTTATTAPVPRQSRLLGFVLFGGPVGRWPAIPPWTLTLAGISWPTPPPSFLSSPQGSWPACRFLPPECSVYSEACPPCRAKTAGPASSS